MDLQVSNSLPSLKVGLDYNILKSISPPSQGLQCLLDSGELFLLVLFLILALDLLDKIFDLLLNKSEMVVLSFPVLVLEGHFFHEDSVGVRHVWELESTLVTN